MFRERVPKIYLLIAILITTGLSVADGREAFQVVSGFTNPLDARGNIDISVDRESPKKGLGACVLGYDIEKGGNGHLSFDRNVLPLAAAGTLKFWVRGNASGNVLQFRVERARAEQNKEGELRFRDRQRVSLKKIQLDFKGWQEISIDLGEVEKLKDVAKNEKLWIRDLWIRRKNEETPAEGSIALDDMRLYYDNAPRVWLSAQLYGARYLYGERDVQLALDARNFTDQSGAFRVTGKLTDRNENVIVKRVFNVELEAGENVEKKLDLRPENLERFLPPFKLTGDVLSKDFPEISERVEQKVICGNSHVLFEPFSNVYGDWLTRGTMGTGGEKYRYDARPQKKIDIRRVKLEKPKGDKADDMPNTPYAMRVDFSGEGMAFNGRRKPQRYFPGNAFRAGFWIKGDGSGAKVSANFLDYYIYARPWGSTWNLNGETKTLCRLDTKEWQYVEVWLPGKGLGKNTKSGGTKGVDFPIEFTGIKVQPRKGNSDGHFLVGPVEVWTQHQHDKNLNVYAGYDNPFLMYDSEKGARILVDNGSPWNARSVKMSWNLSDKERNTLREGDKSFTVEPDKSREVRIKPEQLQIDGDADAPYYLEVSVYDADNPGVRARDTLVLAAPETRAFHTTFEVPRGYLGLKARGVGKKPKEGEPATHTSTEQAHTGKRSLKLPWYDEWSKTPIVSVDPALPGIPVKVSAWVYGDESGAGLFALIGDTRGVKIGINEGRHDLFPAKLANDKRQRIVPINWQGWKKVEFLLPAIPRDWAKDLPVKAFVPSYPLGLHLGVMPPEGENSEQKKSEGKIFVDDIRVRTHLSEENRLELRNYTEATGNIITPEDSVGVRVVHNGVEKKTYTVKCTLSNWLQQNIAEKQVEVTLKPGDTETVELKGSFPKGPYEFDAVASAKEGDWSETYKKNFVVMNPEEVLGKNWKERLKVPSELRLPIGDRFSLVDEDWDWLEWFPGNFQFESALKRCRTEREKGLEPWMLLGYTSYWGAGPGYNQRVNDNFSRRRRGSGSGLDVFMPPERLSDWDNYMMQVMREMPEAIEGWMFWRNPESASAIGVEPEKFAEMLKIAHKWRKVYCPDTPLMLGELNKGTAIPYLKKLGKQDVLHTFDGINVLVDFGVQSPENAGLQTYPSDLRAAIKSSSSKVSEKSVLFSDMDWAVEKGETGLSEFDQAAYLARGLLLLEEHGCEATFDISNRDFKRFGLGLSYREKRRVPPLTEQLRPLHLKAAWWSLYRFQKRINKLDFAQRVRLTDTAPNQSFCNLYYTEEDKPIAVIWRNNPAGRVSFSQSGLKVKNAEDLFGADVNRKNGRYAVGKVPTFFELGSEESVAKKLRLLRIIDREDEGPQNWAQKILFAFDTTAPLESVQYSVDKAKEVEIDSETLQQAAWKGKGMMMKAGGTEKFNVAVPEKSGIVLKKTFWLKGEGFKAEVKVNGNTVGTWDLTKSESEYEDGIRRSVFFIPAGKIGGDTSCNISVTYPDGGSSIAWRIYEFEGKTFPITAFPPIVAKQQVSKPKWNTSIIGAPLEVNEKRFDSGIGVFAKSLLEYHLNNQFSRFKAQVGIDAAAEGHGSVKFQIFGDGDKLWSSPQMSGLDAPKEVDVDVSGINRLRLIVTDGGDGNERDAADWCEPVLVP